MSSLSELRTNKVAPWSRLVAEVNNHPDLIAVVLFCTILFATINLILRFPGLGAIIAQ